MDKSTLKYLTVSQLQEELKRRGLKKSGNKAALIERLIEASAKDEAPEKNIPEGAAPETDQREIQLLQDNGYDKERIEQSQYNNENNTVNEVNDDNEKVTEVNDSSIHDTRNIIDTGQEDNIEAINHENNLKDNLSDEVDEELNVLRKVVTNEEDTRTKLSDEKMEINVENTANEEAITRDAEEHEEESRVVELQKESNDEDDGDAASNVIISDETADCKNETTERNIKLSEEENNDNPDENNTKDADNEKDEGERDDESNEESDKENDVPIQRTSSITDVLHNEDDEDILDYSEAIDEDQQNAAEEKSDKDKNKIGDEDTNEENNDVSEEPNEQQEQTESPEKVEEETSANENADVEMVEPSKDIEATEDGEIKDDEDVKKEQSKPKAVAPVALKKNRVSLIGSTESAEERAARRKRRWGDVALKPSITISGESLNKLMPNVKIDAKALADMDDEDIQVVDKTEVDGPSPAKKSGNRTVKLDSQKKVVLQKKEADKIVIESDNDNAETVDIADKPAASDPPKAVEKISQPMVVHSFDEFGERDRSPSPSQHPATVFIHIANLVRPFTNNQLTRLITRTCQLEENGFWINNIKSNCYIQVKSVEEAIETRQALHGLKWPSGSPKLLEVEFVTNGKIYQETDGAIGKKEKIVIEIDEADEPPKRHGSSRETKKRTERKNSDHHHHERKPEKRKPDMPKEKQESPAKLLDDLFRKTKTAPSIYWLPLTGEQILEKENKKKSSKTNVHTDTRSQHDRPRPHSPGRRRSSPDRRRGGNRSWR